MIIYHSFTKVTIIADEGHNRYKSNNESNPVNLSKSQATSHVICKPTQKTTCTSVSLFMNFKIIFICVGPTTFSSILIPQLTRTSFFLPKIKPSTCPLCFHKHADAASTSPIFQSLCLIQAQHKCLIPFKQSKQTISSSFYCTVPLLYASSIRPEQIYPLSATWLALSCGPTNRSALMRATS